jgi:hypothetical protein
MLTKIAHFARPLWSFVACLLLCGHAFGQASRGQANSAKLSPDQTKKITLTGCLVARRSAQFPLSLDTQDGFFVLTGQTDGLEQYDKREVALEGSRGPDVSIEGFPSTFSSFGVTKLFKVIPKREVKLDPSFTNGASWQVETFKDYGVRVARPESMSAADEPDPELNPNFVSQEDSETVASFRIPDAAYPYANFLGGAFTIFVNRHVTNAGSCLQFGQAVDRSFFSRGNLHYSESQDSGAGMGHGYGYFSFHIFQHSLCYELSFKLDTYYRDDDDCAPKLSAEDERNLVEPLLVGVSFVPPSVPAEPQEKRQVHPQITNFSMSPDTTGFIFSWASKDVDYVDFAYTCATPQTVIQSGVPFVQIMEGVGSFRSCQDFERLNPSYLGGRRHFYYSPNSSIHGSFTENIKPSDSGCDLPTVVVVKLTPYSDGVAHPEASQSLTVNLNTGFASGDSRDMTMTYYPAPYHLFYDQGSPLILRWTQTIPDDDCVNLYLFQADQRLIKLNEAPGCVKASRGCYAWTVTDKYGVDSGFRILVTATRGTSWAWTPIFTIVRPDPNAFPHHGPLSRSGVANSGTT